MFLTSVLVAVQESGAEEELAESFEGITLTRWLTAAAILVGAIVLSRIVKAVAARLVEGDDDGSGRAAARSVGRVVGALVVAVGLVYALASLGVRLGPLLGALGIGGLAFAFAAQSILENTFASILLQVRKPFRRGDQIATGDIEGTVEDVNFRTVNLRTYAGEKVLVPCSEVLNSPIVNYTDRGTRRTDLSVGVAYDADLTEAQRLLQLAASSLTEVHASPAPEVWVEAFGESSVDLVVRFWHAPDQASLWRTRSAVAVAAKGALDAAGIAIPFPQRTIGFLPGSDRIDVRTRSGADLDAGPGGAR